MKKRISIAAFVLAVVLSLGSVPAVNMQTFSYVPETTAVDYAEQFIAEQISVGIADNWNDTTQIAETIYTYDTDGYINGYIFNLETDGQESGYIVLDALAYNLMNVTAFGLENKYHLTDEELFPELENRAIVSSGLLTYSYKKDNKYYDAESGEELTATAVQLKEVCAESIAVTHELKAESELKMAEAADINGSGISTYAHYYPTGNIPDDYVAEVNLPNLDNFIPWETDDFDADNNCVPTAIMNMMKYWTDCRGIAKTDLFITSCGGYDILKDQTFEEVALSINFNDEKGVNAKKAFSTFRKYLENCHKKAIAGDDCLTAQWIDWAWFKTQFANGNAVIVNIPSGVDDVYTPEVDGRKGGHTVVAVGAYAAPGNNYLRIADGWCDNTKHFIVYTYKRYDCAWYYRWA